MTDAEKITAILKLVVPYSGRLTRYEANPDFNPADDGNFNDAYGYGYEDGETHLTRAILAIISKG